MISESMSKLRFASFICCIIFPAGDAGRGSEYSGDNSSAELRHRRDFRAVPIVTIDGETARDFDDAVTVSHLPSGNFELQVHIADVAQYVMDSALDQEARLRGTVLIFRTAPCSCCRSNSRRIFVQLAPQVERLVLFCVMEIDPRGEIASYELCEGVICSAERMTYTAVNAVIK